MPSKKISTDSKPKKSRLANKVKSLALIVIALILFLLVSSVVYYLIKEHRNQDLKRLKLVNAGLGLERLKNNLSGRDIFSGDLRLESYCFKDSHKSSSWNVCVQKLSYENFLESDEALFSELSLSLKKLDDMGVIRAPFGDFGVLDFNRINTNHIRDSFSAYVGNGPPYFGGGPLPSNCKLNVDSYKTGYWKEEQRGLVGLEILCSESYLDEFIYPERTEY